MSRDRELERDPRLQAALRHAPDADQGAPPLLRARILAAAHRRAASVARQGERPRAWWRLDFLGSPWRMGGAGTAVAAVLAATVLWVGRDEQPEAPDLRPRAGDTRDRDTAPAQAVTAAREAGSARRRDSAGADSASPAAPAAPGAPAAAAATAAPGAPAAPPAPAAATTAAPSRRALSASPTTPATSPPPTGPAPASPAVTAAPRPDPQPTGRIGPRAAPDAARAPSDGEAMLERRSDQALDATEHEAAGRAAAERAADRQSGAARGEEARQARAPAGTTSPAPTARLRATPAAPQAAPDAVAAAAGARAPEGAAREASPAPTPFPAGPSGRGTDPAGLAARRLVDQWLAAAESGGWRLAAITGEQARDATPWLAEVAAAARGRWAVVEAPPAHDEEWQLTQTGAARGRVLWTAGAVTLCDAALRRCEQAALDEGMMRALRRPLTR